MREFKPKQTLFKRQPSLRLARLPEADAEVAKAPSSANAPHSFAYEFSRVPITSMTAKAVQVEPQRDKSADADQQDTKSVERRQANDSGEQGVPAIVYNVLRAPGQPLDAPTRTFFASRFGHDFSTVRVHTNAQAAESAAAVKAVAYTVGRDVVFGAGQYQPGTAAGKRLLAHELTHTLQQANGLQASLEVNQPGDPYEQEAERVASAITRNESLTVHGQTGAVVMRQTKTPPTDDPKSKSKPGGQGPFIIPEVLTPVSQKSSQVAVRDITFVKVESGEEALRRMMILNQKAEEEFYKQRLASQTSIGPAGPVSPFTPEQQQNWKAKEILKQQFGEGWGMFFWWTRGGGQTGEDSPFWKAIRAISAANPSIPIPVPGTRPVYRDTRGIATPIEMTK